MTVSKTFRTKCFLFDLDGTLIDTTPLVEAHWRNFAAEHNLDASVILATSHGRRTIDTIREHVPHIATEELVDKYEQAMARQKDGVALLPGVRAILKSLPSNCWAICTSASTYMAEARLNQCDVPIPHVVITADMVKKGKPDPEGYTMAGRELGFPPKECIVVEDAPAGVRAAKASGMRSIGLLTTHRREQLMEAEADVIVRDLSDVQVRIEDDGWLEVTVQE
ncbi:putative glycerol-1-phosphatase [Jimgerdemannia flammicorona]|uniref:Putative glycerol-1-phosphatase n=1 Tax=Jimgerdemannia flammicorona TaxID=994334 RepID=A0A433BCT2_9FUNG|nr:putative glycerol-1-phosphatase [Jimgerdemannia flammicorona]